MNIDRNGKNFKAFAARVKMFPQAGDAQVSEALFGEVERINVLLDAVAAYVAESKRRREKSLLKTDAVLQGIEPDPTEEPDAIAPGDPENVPDLSDVLPEHPRRKPGRPKKGEL